MVIERGIREIFYEHVILRISKFRLVQAWFYGNPLKL
jgi:hypothetical protein